MMTKSTPETNSLTNENCAENCPVCGSTNVSRAEKDYQDDQPVWLFLFTALLIITAGAVLFIFLQLHPVIIILLMVALVTRMLERKSRRRTVRKKQDYLCLDCQHQYGVICTTDRSNR